MNNEFINNLTLKIQKSYEEGITVEEAEKLAGEFLHAQLVIAEALRLADLDSRMRKTGVKAVKAAIYLEEANRELKKPSDVMLEARVNSNDLVIGEQKAFDEIESNRDALQNQLNIMKEAHIYFRSISKGAF